MSIDAIAIPNSVAPVADPYQAAKAVGRCSLKGVCTICTICTDLLVKKMNIYLELARQEYLLLKT